MEELVSSFMETRPSYPHVVFSFLSHPSVKCSFVVQHMITNMLTCFCCTRAGLKGVCHAWLFSYSVILQIHVFVTAELRVNQISLEIATQTRICLQFLILMSASNTDMHHHTQFMHVREALYQQNYILSQIFVFLSMQFFNIPLLFTKIVS